MYPKRIGKVPSPAVAGVKPLAETKAAAVAPLGEARAAAVEPLTKTAAHTSPAHVR